ncbi:MAG: hypothetical protein F6J93_12090 [Oscillatoria sp. SIO1A7]|nr:hypothetical protein [Oscillatoria sp. SIO1A7]
MSSYSTENTKNTKDLLAELSWAIEVSHGEFSLILAKCNYSSWRERMAQGLRETYSGKIREIVLDRSVKKLYATIREELAGEEPTAVMVFGLESVENIKELLTSMNSVREEFRKDCRFPLVLWATDEIARLFLRLAPDIESWSTRIDLAISTSETTALIRETVDRVFARVFKTGATRFMNSVPLDKEGYSSCSELALAMRDLKNRGISLDPELEASVEFILGQDSLETPEKSLAHYDRSLALWPKDASPEKRACVLYYIGAWWRSHAMQHHSDSSASWTKAKDYFQQCIEIFAREKREDLRAKFINALGDALEKLAMWDKLERVGKEAKALHETYENPFRLARAYSFLAEAALGKSAWKKAEESAEEAIAISMETSPDTRIMDVPKKQLGLEWVRSFNQSSYWLALARAQKGQGRLKESQSNLEKALDQTRPNYEPELYIRILQELRGCYSRQSQHIKAFDAKQKQRSIEQQFGFRPFIGAGRLRPSQQVTQAIAGVAPEEKVAPEIAYSGRQQDVNRLVERIGREDRKLTVIYGPSGVGKSSILQAGLIPALKEKPIGSRDVFTVRQRVYTDWIGELAQYLLPTEPNSAAESAESNPTLAAILEKLQENAKSNLLTAIIFDQFEEFFFACTELQERLVFYKFLQECLDVPFLKVILVLREDYIHYLLECNRLANLDAINNNILDKNILYYLGNFSPDDARTTLESLTEKTRFSLERSLIDQLVRDLSGELGEVRPIELQLVGAQLQTDNISTLAEYRDQGTKEALIERYLAEVVRDCGPDNERAAQLLLYLLTDENNTRPLKTKLELAKDAKNLAAYLPAETEKFNLVLKILVGSGLVMATLEHPAKRYQLVHDYLVGFIRHQKGAELIKEIEYARQQTRRSEAERRQSEDKLNQLIKTSLIGSAAAAVVMAFLAGSAFLFAEESQREKNRAEQFQESLNNSLSKYSLLLSANYREFDALLEGVRLGKRLSERGLKATQKTKSRVLASLQQAFFWVRERNRLEGHEAEVASLSFSPDGSIIATASGDKTTKIWSQEGKLLQTLDGHRDAVTSVSFSPDGNAIATASRDNTVKLWTRQETCAGEEEEIVAGTEGDREGDRSQDTGLLLFCLSDVSLEGHGSEVASVRFDPEGNSIAAAYIDGTIRVWSRDGKIIQTFQAHDAQITSLSFSPDGKTLASTSRDDTTKLWSREKICQQKVEDAIEETGEESGASSDRQRVAVKVSSKPVYRHGIPQSDDPPKPPLKTPSASLPPLAKEGVWGGFSSATERISELSFCSKPIVLKGHKADVTGVSFSPDGKTIATGSQDRTVKLWTREGKIEKTLWKHGDWVTDVSFSPDGKTIASASWDKTVQLWSRDGENLQRLRGHEDAVNSISFSPDGKTIASGSGDRTTKLWNIDREELRILRAHSNQVASISFSSDGKTMATASLDTTAKLWSEDGRLLSILAGHNSDITGISFSPDDSIVATGSRDRTVKLWSRDGRLLQTLEGHTSGVTSISFSPDGKTIASGSRDKTVKLWHRRDGVCAGEESSEARNTSDRQNLLPFCFAPTTLRGHEDEVTSVSFSPDGATIASASRDKTAKLWQRQDACTEEIAEGNQQEIGLELDLGQNGEPDKKSVPFCFAAITLRGHSGGVNSVTFSPDGNTIATASKDRTTRLWNQEGKELKTLQGHDAGVTSVSFSPDGDTLATAGRDGTVKLWTDTGEKLRTLERHENWVTSIRFSPDGKILASSDSGGRVILWRDLDLDLDKLLARSCDWLGDYLKYNPNISKSDRGLCDDFSK